MLRAVSSLILSSGPISTGRHASHPAAAQLASGISSSIGSSFRMGSLLRAAHPLAHLLGFLGPAAEGIGDGEQHGADGGQGGPQPGAGLGDQGGHGWVIAKPRTSFTDHPVSFVTAFVCVKVRPSALQWIVKSFGAEVAPDARAFKRNCTGLATAGKV